MSTKLGITLLLVTLCACSEELEDAQQAVNAARALMDVAKDAEKAGRAAERASLEAEAKAREQIPEGATEKEAELFVQNAKAAAGLQAMGKAVGGGPITNWRQLEPFLPDTLGDLKAKGPLDGSTTRAGGVKVTKVSRKYTLGEARVGIGISDTWLAPILRAPFALVAMVDEDSTRGFKKGTKIGEHTAIVSWVKASKRSRPTGRAGGRGGDRDRL